MLVGLVDVLKVLLCWISDQSCVMSELSLTIWATAEVVKLGWFTELGSVKLAAAYACMACAAGDHHAHEQGLQVVQTL
jgi:hypothetical protein